RGGASRRRHAVAGVRLAARGGEEGDVHGDVGVVRAVRVREGRREPDALLARLEPAGAPHALTARIRVEGDDLRVLAWDGPPGPVG
ncbi:MAG: hypothetical protein ACKOSO_07980, partial [Actinomycetota bacterium]